MLARLLSSSAKASILSYLLSDSTATARDEGKGGLLCHGRQVLSAACGNVDLSFIVDDYFQKGTCDLF